MKKLLSKVLPVSLLFISSYASAIQHPTCTIEVIDMNYFVEKYKQIMTRQVPLLTIGKAGELFHAFFNDAAEAHPTQIFERALTKKGYFTRVMDHWKVDLMMDEIEKSLVAAFNGETYTPNLEKLLSSMEENSLYSGFNFEFDAKKRFIGFSKIETVSVSLSKAVRAGDNLQEYKFFHHETKISGFHMEKALLEDLKDLPVCETDAQVKAREQKAAPASTKMSGGYN